MCHHLLAFHNVLFARACMKLPLWRIVFRFCCHESPTCICHFFLQVEILMSSSVEVLFPIPWAI